MDVCREVMHEPTPVDGGGMVRCHLQTSGPTLAGRSITEVERPQTVAVKRGSTSTRR